MHSEFTDHHGQRELVLIRRVYAAVVHFRHARPEGTIADFEQFVLDETAALQQELDEAEQAKNTAVEHRPLVGPLADPLRQEEFRRQQRAGVPGERKVRDDWWQERRTVLRQIEEQGAREALEWDCRDCGALTGTTCRTAGGKNRDPHFLRSVDAQQPYLRAYGLRRDA